MEADSSDDGNIVNLYRFRSGSYVLYVEVEPHCILIEDKCDYGFPPAIRKLLPPTLPSSHNLVKITSNGEITSCKHDFKGVETIWHPTKVDITTLPVVRVIKCGVYKVKYRDRFAVAKVARFEYEIRFLESETRVYRDIDGQDIGPKFLGHLTENGRTMGILLEHLDDFRVASKEDLSLCITALGRLHALGFVHGDVSRFNFLIRRDRNCAKLIDFDCSKNATDAAIEVELSKMLAVFKDESFRWGEPRNEEDRTEEEYVIGI